MRQNRRKSVKPFLSGLTIAALVLVVAIILSGTFAANATLAQAIPPTGHVKYYASTVNVGSYSTQLSSAASKWNTAITNYGCSNNVSLAASSSNNIVTVSYVSTYSDISVLGRVSLWATDIYGDGFQMNLETHSGSWEWAFLYVYPSNISYAISTSDVYSTSDLSNCILATSVHEFGHILGLLHPANTELNSVMQQGLSTNSTPTAYDKSELHAQWCS